MPSAKTRGVTRAPPVVVTASAHTGSGDRDHIASPIRPFLPAKRWFSPICLPILFPTVAVVRMQSSERFAHLSFVGAPVPPGDQQGTRPRRFIEPRISDEAERGGSDVSLTPEQRVFFSWLQRRTNLDLSEYRDKPLARRISACCRAFRVRDLRRVREAVEREPSLISRVLDAFLIGATEFYRDREVFDDLRGWVAVQAAASPQRSFTVWSAACSDGSEIYSMVMLVSELGLADRFRFYASDVRWSAVTEARQGVFHRSAMEQVPEEQRKRYFTIDSDGDGVVRERLRRQVQFLVHDACATLPPFNPPVSGGFDIVLCRNLAIYFEAERRARLWSALSRGIAPTGLLVVGKAERPVGFRKVAPCLFVPEAVANTRRAPARRGAWTMAEC